MILAHHRSCDDHVQSGFDVQPVGGPVACLREFLA
jgi:hypothetical protein